MMRTLALSVAFAVTLSSQALAQKVTLALDWFLNPDHAPILVAIVDGNFARHGLDVSLIEPADPNDPPKLVAAGMMDIAITYQPNLHMQVDQGLPVMRVGTLIGQPLNTLLALGDGPVQSIADLKGRKIGYSVGGFEEALLGTMLEKHGLALSDVTLVNVNFSLAPSLMAGQVDAVIGAYRNFEINILDMRGRTARPFFVENEGVPAYDELVFITHAARASEAWVGAFMTALTEATGTLKADPQAAWSRVLANWPKLDDELNNRAFNDTWRLFADNPRALDVARYDAFAAFLLARGLISAIKPVESYASSP